MLTDRLEELKRQKGPKSLDELYNSSKERIMADRVMGRVKESLNSIKNEILSEIGDKVSSAVKDSVGKIRVRDGKDGLPGLPGKDGQDAKINISELKKDLGLDSLEIKDIKGLETMLGNIRRNRGGGGGGMTLIVDDLTSQNNGSTRTYTTTKRIGTIISVSSTQFPTILRPTTDYTGSGQTLTLDTGIGPIESGQTLIVIYSEG